LDNLGYFLIIWYLCCWKDNKDCIDIQFVMSKVDLPVNVVLKPGMRLGKYRLEKLLGTGGSCEVWKARDCVEDILVALKIPQVDVTGKRDNQRLFREIRLVAQLRHPHILSVKNADIIDGHAVLATELSFRTLEDCSKPMSLQRIMSIMVQVLEGLAYAHRRRLVHCDVTPGNIFLFPDGRAALGDFGISLKIKGRMQTIDDFGTPGYVAPEQAYGRPTHRSDCFAAALILYEYITGFLPRWPFRWPPRGLGRLKEKTNLSMVKLREVMPKVFLKGVGKSESKKKPDWQKLRRQAFIRRYKKVFPVLFRCVDCGEPVAESMMICPWCGSNRNRFDSRSRFSHICPRCHKGVLPEWRFCPWCYGAGFKSPSSARSKGVRYNSQCKYCGGKMMRFMRYCPWCHRKVRRPWKVRIFPDVCKHCRWPVDSSFWNYCPWCETSLL